MGSVTLRAVAVSIVRALVALALAWFVQRQMLDHSLAEEAAGLLAFLIVDRSWELYQRHREELHRALYQQWLVIIGLRERASLDPERQALQAKYVTAEAKARANAGMLP